MEAQRARALRGSCLQKALRPELRHWVRYGNCLPLEQPAGHRKANCRVAQMHDFHRRPPVRLDLFTLRGGTSLTLSAQYQRAGSRTRHNSAIKWHRSNSGNTHQWMSTPGNSSSRNHDARANSRRADRGIHPSAEINVPLRNGTCGRAPSMRSGLLLTRAAGRRYHYGGEAPLSGQLLEVRQVAPLQLFPTRQ